MKIVICGSVSLTKEIAQAQSWLEKAGHEVEIPYVSQLILSGQIPMAEFLAEKGRTGDLKYRHAAPEDLIRRYYRLIKEADAVLILNADQKGVPGYIGGNTFLEMGFAHVLQKKIFVLQPLPEAAYRDELLAMEPTVINNDLSLIK